MKRMSDVLKESNGVGQGFDFLRIVLAFAVVTWHTPVISIGSRNIEEVRFFWFGNYAILAMFFCLSGFLIAGSALRLSLANFLINRGLRIFPALAVEIILSALILGPLFTNLPLSDYITNAETIHYITNIFGFINYLLPGVFRDHPRWEVNTSLWTVPFELGCYALMSTLMITGLLRRPISLLLLAVSILIIGVLLWAWIFNQAKTLQA